MKARERERERERERKRKREREGKREIGAIHLRYYYVSNLILINN